MRTGPSRYTQHAVRILVRGYTVVCRNSFTRNSLRVVLLDYLLLLVSVPYLYNMHRLLLSPHYKCKECMLLLQL